MNEEGIDGLEITLDYMLGKDPYNVDAIDFPVTIAAFKEWDMMEEKRRSRILGGMLRNTIKRIQTTTPLYRNNESWQAIQAEDIESSEDLTQLPLISKDSVAGTGGEEKLGIKGFRNELVENPNLLVPNNFEWLIERQEAANQNHKEILEAYGGRRILEFGSGGSQGKSTITKLSYLTVEMEAYALVRALKKNGLKRGDSIACFYNDSHKGGLQLERAAAIMGMPFHAKRKIFAALANDVKYQKAVYTFQTAIAQEEFEIAEQYAPRVREGIREYIKAHQIKVIESVQPPALYMEKNAKGSALAFMTLFNEDHNAFASVEHAFLTGFPVPKDAYERLREYGMSVSTTWGSTEAMALATYAKNSLEENVNCLEENPFPTIGLVAWHRERERRRPILKRAPEGTEGLLLVTSLIGAGSVYINYRIGDKAIAQENAYYAINRSELGDINGSCAADALRI